MSARKKVTALVIAAVCLVLIVGGFTAFVLGIWTGDVRWIHTGFLFFPLGLFVAFAAVTFPGWDW